MRERCFISAGCEVTALCEVSTLMFVALNETPAPSVTCFTKRAAVAAVARLESGWFWRTHRRDRAVAPDDHDALGRRLALDGGRAWQAGRAGGDVIGFAGSSWPPMIRLTGLIRLTLLPACREAGGRLPARRSPVTRTGLPRCRGRRRRLGGAGVGESTRFPVSVMQREQVA